MPKNKDTLKVVSPENMNVKFAETFNSGEIESLLSLYETDAVLIDQSGAARVGLSDIRRELLDLLKLGGKIISCNEYAFQIGKIALLRASWKLEGANVQGESVTLTGNSIEIIRQQPDGRWLYIFDHPSGADSVSESCRSIESDRK